MIATLTRPVPAGGLMPETQAALFDARPLERVDAHRLTFLSAFGSGRRGSCPCGAQFAAPTSDLLADAFRAHLPKVGR